MKYTNKDKNKVIWDNWEKYLLVNCRGNIWTHILIAIALWSKGK